MEEGRRIVEVLERKSSIETEPRTLHLNQIRDAREAALYVLQTRTMEEAMQIFTATQGVEKVRGEEKGDREDYEELEDDDCYELQILRHHLAEHGYRDVVSAPF